MMSERRLVGRSSLIGRRVGRWRRRDKSVPWCRESRHPSPRQTGTCQPHSSYKWTERVRRRSFRGGRGSAPEFEGVSIIVVLLLRLLLILTLSVPPGHLYLGSHAVHSGVVPSLYFPAGHAEFTTPSVHW